VVRDGPIDLGQRRQSRDEELHGRRGPGELPPRAHHGVLTLESLFLSGLIAAVPDEHKEFLRNLAWVHEQVWLVPKCFRYDRSPEEFTMFTFRTISR
jgi:hypothetical protein